MTRETSALGVLMVTPGYFPFMGGTEAHVHEVGRRLVVAPGNRCALRDAVQVLLGDPMLREGMGMMAKQRVAEFQAQTVVPRIEQVNQEVLYS